MEEFQTMMEDQEEFEGESILEDFEDFVMGYNFFPVKFHDAKRISFDMRKWGASSCWSFGPNSEWGSIETTTIWKTHHTLSFLSFPSKEKN